MQNMDDYEEFDQSPQESPREASPQEVIADLAKIAALVAVAVKKGYDMVMEMRSDSYAELTYSDVIRELVDQKPRDPAIAKGAILRKRLNVGKIELTLFYLDRANQPVWGPNPKRPYGCRKQTEQLDAELLDFFGNKDLLILE